MVSDLEVGATLSETSDLEERVRMLEMRQARTDERMDTVAQDVKEIKNTLTWLNRLAVGAVILAVINLVIKTGGI